jgi:hypothetical protein
MSTRQTQKHHQKHLQDEDYPFSKQSDTKKAVHIAINRSKTPQL